MDCIISNFVVNFSSICGYSNKISLKNFNEDDFVYIEKFAQTELIKRLSEKYSSMKIQLNDKIKALFFGVFATDTNNFKFSENDRKSICSVVRQLNDPNNQQLSQSKENEIMQKKSTFHHWFDEESDNGNSQIDSIVSPIGAQNLLGKMLQAAKNNAMRPKQGYRYCNDFKRFVVHNRILSVFLRWLSSFD